MILRAIHRANMSGHDHASHCEFVVVFRRDATCYHWILTACRIMYEQLGYDTRLLPHVQ